MNYENRNLLNNRELIEEDLDKFQLYLNESQSDYENDSTLFYKKNIFKMGRLIRLYSDLMEHLNVHVREDVELELENYSNNDDLIDKFRLLNRNWNDFLNRIEQNAKLASQNKCINELDLNIYASSKNYFQQILPSLDEKNNINVNNNDSYFNSLNLSLVDLQNKFIEDKISNNLPNYNKKSFMLLVMLRHFAWY